MNEFTRLTPEQGFHVYGWMRMRLGLKGTELDIYAIVYSYTQNGGEGVGGNRFFMEWTGASEDTVTRSLKNLEQAGLITASGTGRGKLKKYTVADNANYPQNAGTNTELPAKCGYNHPQNAGTTTRKMRVHHPQNAGSNQNKKEIESKLERKIDNTTLRDNTTTTREETLPPIVKQAMQPYTAPKYHEVYSAMRGLMIRPMGTELDKCAHAFYDQREAQGWSKDWKSHMQRFAASWLNRLNQVKDQARGCQPDDPIEDYGDIPW